MHTRRFGQLAARTFLAGALLAGVAACGDDDDDAAVDAPAGDGEQAAGGGNEEFCTALVDFNAMVPQVELDEESTEADMEAAYDQLEPVWAGVRDNAPEDVQAEIDELDPIIQGLAEGDGEAFNDDETFETYSEMVSKAIPSCDFETASVRGVDYAFEGIPETLPAGTVAVEFENASEEEEHEMVVFKKNDPDQSTEELFALPEEEAMGMITFAGFAFAPPGGSSSSLLALEAGSYTVVCFIPVGGEEDGPPHFTQGMTAEFTVE
ncbi:MAG: hypothetical protein WD232_00595 [Acidimicrobiales bacterium]